MSLFQQAIATYDAYRELAGVKTDNYKEPLAPISHAIRPVSIEITVDSDGEFVSACRINEKVPIPCTEASAGRTSSIAPHPLCDTVEYIAGLNEDKHKAYVSALKKFAGSDYGCDKVSAILNYVTGDTVLNDLKQSGVLEYSDDGRLKSLKDIIVWRVNDACGNSIPVYTDTDLQSRYSSYYMETRDGRTKDIGLCMITGETTLLSKQHLKGISKTESNAKLISANDKQNFTYRGRFATECEALSVGYISSQKAMNALKWVVANKGVYIDKRVYVCWNPGGHKVPGIDASLALDGADGESTGNSKNKDKDEVVKHTPESYAQKLNEVILGYTNELPKEENVVMAAFDAATPGRLAVVYYSRLQGSDFLARLKDWDETCCWDHPFRGVQAPSLYKIANYACGTYKGKNRASEKVFESDSRTLNRDMQSLIACRLDGCRMPRDIMERIVRKASTLHLYPTSVRIELISTACAVVRKYHWDHFNVLWDMVLEPDKKDRSYQYGRLMAVLEKLERDTYREEETRDPSIIRSQEFFVQHPKAACEQLIAQIRNAYYPKLNIRARAYYDKLIREIMETVSDCSAAADDRKPLKETYLIGYYLQMKALYTKHNSNTVESKAVIEEK